MKPLTKMQMRMVREHAHRTGMDGYAARADIDWNIRKIQNAMNTAVREFDQGMKLLIPSLQEATSRIVEVGRQLNESYLAAAAELRAKREAPAREKH